MSHRIVLIALVAALALPAAAQQACNLEIAVSCTPGSNNTSSCVSTTRNAGATSCSGEIFTGYFGGAGAKFLSFSNSLGLADCFNSSDFPVAEGDTSPFAFCFGFGSLGAGQQFTSSATIQGSTDGVIIGFTGIFDPENFDEQAFVFAQANVAALTCTPTISSPPVTRSGLDYIVNWTAVSDPTAQFIVEESTSADFSSGVTSRQVASFSSTFRHDVSTTTTYYYRVRATNCGGNPTPLSAASRTVVQAPAPATNLNPEATVPFGTTQPVSIQVFIPGIPDSIRTGGRSAFVTTTFTASTNKAYLTVTPASGTLPPQGTTVTVTAAPGSLPPGASTGTVTVKPEGAPPINTPVSINLVTPVAPMGKSTPPPTALIIPVVTHVNGVAGPFLSDVRLTNATGGPVKYQVGLTPTGTDGSKNNKVTTVTVGSQETTALNDIVKNFFGFGATGAQSDIGFGSLEIRPIDSGSNLTFASSRTYASTVNGTFGQFVAAVPFANFATRRQSLALPGAPGSATRITRLSLQQVAQSTKFRTNFGIAEGAGEPASGVIRIYNAAGSVLKTVDFSLQPGEQKQLNSFISANGVPTLEDGRLEVEITSDTGAVTAYASVLDNITTDPLAVAPVNVSAISSTRYVVPGMSEFDNGLSNFHSDVRLFNGGTSDVVASLTYYPIANPGGAVSAAPVTIRAGEMKVFDNIVPTLFNVNSGAGSLVVTTSSPSSLVATGRTYTRAKSGGTFGQFIPGIMPSDGLALGDRPLQMLQLEQSDQFRSNLGLVELTGNPVMLRVSLYVPDTKASPSIMVPLRGNEFTQLGRVIEQFMGAGSQTYNARIAIQVVEGSGRVSAYASVIDNKSVDPTYVPAQ